MSNFIEQFENISVLKCCLSFTNCGNGKSILVYPVVSYFSKLCCEQLLNYIVFLFFVFCFVAFRPV